MFEQRESLSCDKGIDEIDDFLKDLKRFIPHIDWDLQYHDHDLGYYITLSVPLCQFSEAEQIISEYENEELDLCDYDPYNRYPGLYQYNDESQKYIINEIVSDYIQACETFRSRVDNIIEEPILDSMPVLIRDLSQLFHKADLLPNIYEDISFLPGFDDPPQGNFIFGDQDTFNRMPEYYIGSKADIENISEMIVDIYQDIDYGLKIYEEANEQDQFDEFMAAAIWSWRHGHKKENGWGDNSLKVIELIRKCIRKLPKKK